MECPTLAPIIAVIAAAGIGRVAYEVGVVVQRALIDGEELMPLDPRVV
jgi:hypothetical protein